MKNWKKGYILNLKSKVKEIELHFSQKSKNYNFLNIAMFRILVIVLAKFMKEEITSS